MRWPGCSLTGVVAGLAFSMLVIRAEEFDVPPIPLWHRSVTLITGAGYKDNLLLSRRFRSEESEFIKTGLELFVTRLPLEGPQLHFAVTGEDVRFLSSEVVEKEQLLFTEARIVQEFGARWEASMALEYSYLDEVADVSASDPFLTTAPLRGHSVRANPSLRHKFGDGSAVELAFPVARHSFSAPVDDYWEGGPKLTFERPYGEKSEWSVSFSYNYFSYDTRPQSEADGSLILGSSLGVHQPKTELVWRHYLDQTNRWRISTRLSHRLEQDNGSGFFNYMRFQISEQIRYRAGGWDIAAEASVAYYDYAIQPVSPVDRSTRDRTDLRFNFRCERQLVRWLKLFAEYEYEKIISNRTIDEYSVNLVNGGLMWEF